MEFTREIIMKRIKKLKRKKAPDVDGWKNEMILDGGEDMVEAITMMFN